MKLQTGSIQWNVGEEVPLNRITNFDADEFLNAHPDLPDEVKMGEGRHIGEATDKIRMLERSVRQLEKLLREGRADSEAAERIEVAIDKAKTDGEKIRKVLDSNTKP
jgi:hypothetical protein